MSLYPGRRKTIFPMVPKAFIGHGICDAHSARMSPRTKNRNVLGAEGEEGGEPGDLYLKVKFRKPLLQKVGELLKNW